MVKIFPQELRSDVRSNAERHLYQALKEQLSDDFTVFHQVRWQMRASHTSVIDGEADFVIACPNLGILVIEVKGGSIHYDINTHRWYSNGNSIKDPFQQACDSKYTLLKLLKKLHFWKNKWIPIGHAVAFPEVRINNSLSPDAPCEIILDGTHLSDLSGWVKSALTYYRSQDLTQGNFDANSIKELIKILSPSLFVRPNPETTELEFISTTEEQLGILDFLSSHRRVAISGCAGSGKTLLALDKARRLNEQGFSVLVTCYNKALANFLKDSLNKSRGFRPDLHVYTFHGICEKLLHKAGFTAPDTSIPQEQLFQEVYPNLLIAAADKLNWRVDAVIVDEGQDFCEDWWVALKLLLHNPDDGIYYFFHDNNQDIFGRGWRPPLEEAPFVLTKNCRNTQRIHEYVLQFHNQQHLTTARGPLGKEVEIVNYRGDLQLRNTLGRLLHRLVFNDGFSAKDIVILTTKRKQALQNQLLGQFRVRAHPDTNSQEILCNTIHYFKGLESKVVILVETELDNANRHNKLMYVGASRARHHLIILQPDG